MAPILHVRLLGGFSLTLGDTLLPEVNTPRLQSLIAYLVLHCDVPQPRRHLAFLLWPDSSEPQARTNLRNLLHYLRRSLPEADRFLQVDAQALQWRRDAPFALDVARFREAEAAGNLGEAAALYRGDLLPDCYDDWIVAERERLQSLSASVLEHLAGELEQKRDYAGAIGCVRRLIQHDPLREEPYRRLMRLHALAGDRAAAIHVYHTCATTLQRELDVEPAPATRLAYERLLQAETEQPAVALRATLPLVGREREWKRLLSMWRTTATGGPRLVLLEGEAGIGKTRLAEELVAWAGRQGLPAAAACCYPAALGLPFAPVSAWLRARPLPALEPLWLSEVARLLPEILAERPTLPQPGPLGEEWQRQRLYAALARAIHAGPQPRLLLIEDLQWCDPETLPWLHYLLRFDPQARLLIVGTLRLEEIAPDGALAAVLRAMRQEGLVAEIELGPLDEGETAALAAKVAGSQVGAKATRLYRETEGNPLFVVEMVRAGALGQGGRDPAPAAVMPPQRETSPHGLGRAAPLPPRVLAVIAARLEQLSPQARELLAVAAVVGREFTFDVLLRATGGEEDSLIRALDELWQRRIIREQGTGSYDFGHHKLREVAYGALSAARRRLLHRRVAEALEALAPDQAETLAYHLAQAQLWERAAHYQELAATQARAVHAYDAALAHLDDALALADRAGLGAEARYRLLGVREAALEVLGRREAQAADLETMAGIARAARDSCWLGEVYRRQARLFTLTGRYDEAEAAAREGLALAEGRQDIAGQAAALAALGTAADLRGEPARAIPHLRAAVDLCRQGADRQQLAEARNALASALLGVKDYSAAHAEAEAALALYQALDSRLGQAEALSALGIISMEQGAPEEAIGCYRRSLDACRAIGYRYGEGRALTNWGNVLYTQGELAEALARYDEAGAIFRAIGNRRGEAIVRLNTAAIRYSVLGDGEGAERDAETALAYSRAAGDHSTEGHSLSALGAAARQRGDLVAARRQLEAGVAALEPAGERWVEAQARITLVYVGLDEGRPEAALADLEAAEALCRELGMASLGADLLAARGAVLLALGRPEEALAATSQAVQSVAALSAHWRHLAPFMHYRALLAMGRKEEARAALARARQVVLDLVRDLAPAEQRLSLQRQPEFRAIMAAWEGG